MNATFAPIAPLGDGWRSRHSRVRSGSPSSSSRVALGLGVSTFVSVGNKADVCTNDLLQFWEGDDGTDVVLLYVESFGNPRSFSRIARRVRAASPSWR